MADNEFKDKTFERVAKDSPDRCQMIGHDGEQCMKKRMPNGKYCGICDQGTTVRRENKQNIELFNLARHQERVKQFREHPRQKTLTDEIGILRLLLEDKINSCNTPSAMLINSQSISNLVIYVKDLVTASAKLDTQLNNTLTKAQIDVFIQRTIEIISRYVEPAALESIATDLQSAAESL